MMLINNKYNGPPVQPKGEDTVEALRDWGKDELKSGVSRTYDLGKFLFSVSAATLGLIAGLARVFNVSATDWFFVGALVALILSIIVALIMVVPRIWALGEDTDLAFEYTKIIRASRTSLFLWILLWMLGVSCIFGALFVPEPEGAVANSQIRQTSPVMGLMITGKQPQH